MTPDEVRMLDNRYALLFIRGERPVKDLKYNILKHPNVALTTDGKAVAYQHGTDPLSVAAVSINLEKLKQAIPFGPFLCAAAVTAYFWGREIITCYWRMFL